MRYDNQGRPVVSADWNALSSIPAIVKNLGNLTTTAGGIIVATDTAGTLENLAVGSANYPLRIDPDTSLPAYGLLVPGAIDPTGASDGQVITLVSGVPAFADSSSAITTGSFTATLIGLTSSVTGTINYATDGTRVMLWAVAAIGGTSNADVFGFTGLPSGLQPDASESVPGRAVTSNGGTYLDNDDIVLATAYVWASDYSTPGEVDFAVWETDLFTNRVAPAVNGWTSSSNKQINIGWTIVYPLAA